MRAEEAPSSPIEKSPTGVEQYTVEMQEGMLGFELLSTPSQMHCIFSVDQQVGQAYPKGVCVGDLLVGLNGLSLQKYSHRRVLHALQNTHRPYTLTLDRYDDRRQNEHGCDIGKWILATKAAEPKRLVFNNPGDLGIDFRRVYGTILITKVAREKRPPGGILPRGISLGVLIRLFFF